MARFHQLFRCIGEAVCANGLKALAGLVPMGGVVFEIAENTCQRLRESQQDEQLAEFAGTSGELPAAIGLLCRNGAISRARSGVSLSAMSSNLALARPALLAEYRAWSAACKRSG